jgi:S1-C subfamily serine protease
MRTDSCNRVSSMKLLAIALITVAATASQAAAQSAASPRVRSGSATDASAGARVPLGYTIAMFPGPGNAYTYPIVTGVTSGSNAERAGLAVGDTLIAVNDHDLREAGPAFPVREAGTRYVIRVRRGGEEKELVYIFPAAPPPGH